MLDSKKSGLFFLKRLAPKWVYFSHSLVSDISRKKFYPAVDYISLVSKDSFTKPLLFVEYTKPNVMNGYVNKLIEEPKKFDYHIKNDNFDLNLKSRKKPLLEEGSGYVHLKSRGSYYYSLTNLETKGVIKTGKKEIKVSGKSWMDHQWANSDFQQKHKWTWFSIQLKNKAELVCFKFSDSKQETRLATISYANNKQKSVRDVSLTAFGKPWMSKETKANYQLDWSIKIPSLKLDLTVKPLVRAQEMLFGNINYWEGPLDVSGKMNGKRVSGQGFLEIYGPSRGISDLKLYKREINKLLKEK